MKVFGLYVDLLSWYDGDTFRAVVDQGFRVYRGKANEPVRCRCAVINAPELRTSGGPEALAYAQILAPPGEYQCRSFKPTEDGFGRPILDLWLPVEDGGPGEWFSTGPGEWFSNKMLAAGHAVVYVG